MTDHPHQLYAVEFTEADQARLAGLSCGAIRFYEKCGFELISGVVRRNDHVVMKLWIGEYDQDT